MNRMCIDPDRFEPDEYWRSLGLVSVEQVRHEVLWRAVEDGTRPGFVDACPECSALYESFVRLRAISVVGEAGGSVAIACCPDAVTLAGYQGGDITGHQAEAIRDHLKICPPCREDLAFLARSQEPRERLMSLRGRTILMALAAAALLAAIIPWHRESVKEKVKLNFTPTSRWASLVNMPAVDRAEMMKDSPEAHHSRVEQVLAAYEKGDYVTAEKYAAVMTSVVEDPSAEFLLAMARYKQNKIMDGYEAMVASERIAPLSAARCWATLQYALLVGDRKTVEREAKHVENDDGYGAKCKDILSKLT